MQYITLYYHSLACLGILFRASTVLTGPFLIRKENYILLLYTKKAVKWEFPQENTSLHSNEWLIHQQLAESDMLQVNNL